MLNYQRVICKEWGVPTLKELLTIKHLELAELTCRNHLLWLCRNHEVLKEDRSSKHRDLTSKQ